MVPLVSFVSWWFSEKLSVHLFDWTGKLQMDDSPRSGRRIVIPQELQYNYTSRTVFC